MTVYNFYIKILFVFSFFWGSIVLDAQHPVVFQLGEKDGLPNSEIYDMIHSLDGFLWLGTDRGLFRYDGSEFRHYPIQSASPAKTHFVLDKKGHIWCMNFSNQIFYLENDSLREFTPLRTQKINRLKNFDIDSNKELLWLATARGIWMYNLVSKQWKSYHSDKTIQDIKVTKNSVFASTSNRYFFYDNTLDSFISPKFIFPEQSSHLSFVGNKLFSSAQQFTPAPNSSGIHILEQNHFKPLLLPNIEEIQNSSNMFWVQDAHKNYWLLTNNGALGYTPDLKKTLLNGKRLLPGKIITELLLDKEGTYWVSTLQNGLYQIPALDVVLFNEQNSTLIDNRLTAITTYSSNQLLLADKLGNICLWDTKQQTNINSYKIKNNSQNIYHFGKNPQTKDIYFSYGKLNKQLELEDDYSPPTKTTCLYNNHLIIGSNLSTIIVNLSPSFGVSAPLYQYGIPQINSNSFTYNLIRRQRTRTVHADTFKNRFWVGYSDDLYCYTPENMSFSIIKNSKDQSNIIATDIKQSSDRILWISTTENGVLGLQDTTVVFHYTLANGLSSNSCTKLLIDEKDKIWVLADNGINKIDYKSGKIELFDKKDGLDNYNLQNFIFHQDLVYVITSKGLITFPKKMSFKNDIAPSIFLDRIAINNKDTTIFESYNLAYDQNNIKINFNALAYRSQGDFQFKYRMLGIDTTWQYISSNTVNFLALSDGEYTFEAKVLNEDKVESKEKIQVEFVIHPPFWKTLWFNALILLIIALFIWQVYRYRLNNIKTQHQLEQDRNKLALEKSEVEQQFRSSQLAALKAQMNPHFIFNALNSIQEYILLNEKRLANEYLGKFADLMRLTLDMSNQQTVTLEDELKSIRLYLDLEAVRFEDSFSYTINLDSKLQHSHIRLPSMLIQPYIENAIKHGLLHKITNRKLVLNFELNIKEELLVCTIKDNGIGRKAAMRINKNRPDQHKSFAMTANQKRLELLNYTKSKTIALVINDLYNSAGEAMGTEVILNIPVEVI